MSELHVIFGTGALGKWTMRELLTMGKKIRMINRSGNRSGIPDAVEVVKGDAYDAAFCTTVTQGATAVYQCAQPDYDKWAGNFPRLQAAILEGAATHHAKLILGDNLYSYGKPAVGNPLTEDSPTNAHTKKGAIRKAMTETALAAHRSGKVRVAIGRASDFFGPEERITADLVYFPALKGESVKFLGRLDMPHTFSYVPDFGKALAIMGNSDAALGAVWHIPSAPPVTQAELVKMISEEVGRPVKPLMLGKFMATMLGLFNPLLRETVEMMYEWTAPFVMSSEKFERAFKVSPTPLRQAVKETVAWAKSVH